MIIFRNYLYYYFDVRQSVKSQNAVEDKAYIRN